MLQEQGTARAGTGGCLEGGHVGPEVYPRVMQDALVGNQGKRGDLEAPGALYESRHVGLHVIQQAQGGHGDASAVQGLRGAGAAGPAGGRGCRAWGCEGCV